MINEILVKKNCGTKSFGRGRKKSGKGNPPSYGRRGGRGVWINMEKEVRFKKNS